MTYILTCAYTNIYCFYIQYIMKNQVNQDQVKYIYIVIYNAFLTPLQPLSTEAGTLSF